MVRNKKVNSTLKNVKQSSSGKSRARNSELTALTAIWQDFSKSMGSQLMEVMHENQAEYEKLYGKWTDLSDKFGARLTKNIKGGSKEYTELYNVWKNYANKLSTRLSRIGNNGGIDYDMLQKNWQNYTRKLNMELFETGKDNNINSIFSTWDNFYRNMTQQMDDVMKGGRGINNEFTVTWEDFTSKMNTLLENLSADSTDISALNKDWQNFSVEFNRGITTFIKNYESDLTKLQKEWLKNTEKVGETLTDTFDLISESYGEIYKKYFERTAPYLQGIEMYSQTRVKSLEHEVADLKKRLDRMESKSRRK